MARLLMPLGIRAEGTDPPQSLLDLSAGLGGPLRALTQIPGITVTGLESNGRLIGEGDRVLYDPATFQASDLYDGVMARELFYRVAHKAVFFESILKALKPGRPLVFTDYVLDTQAGLSPTVTGWLIQEPHAEPLCLEEMRQAWASVGIMDIESDDETVPYLAEVRQGLGRLAAFLQDSSLDDVTRAFIHQELTPWLGRADALASGGVKLYRFRVLKPREG